MSFPRYHEYKDSGVEWLGEVPAHWQAMRLKQLIAEVDERAGQGDYELLGLSKSRGVVGRTELEQGASESDNYAKYKVADAGQLVMNKMQAWNGVFGLSPRLGMVSPDYAVFRFIESEYDTYLSTLFRTDLMAGIFYTRCKGMGTAFLRLNTPDFLDIKVPLPPVDDAKGIITFLDRETAKIDALVAEQEKLIALLKEKRQAVISHAVTKGLDPNVPMKHSGIAWLGEVPAHWEMKRLKHMSPFITVGIVVNPSSFVADEGSPFIYGGDIREGVIDWKNSRRIDSKSSEENSKTRLQAGDLLTVRVGAPGVTAVVPPECEGGNCASVMLVRRGSFNSHWLCYAMNTRIVRFQVEVVQYGAAQEQFNISHAVNFWTPMPPRAEQDEIAEFLASETATLDALTTEAERAIELLTERRSALISAAVTGKIDVRGAATLEAAA